jgi:dCTP deaminase
VILSDGEIRESIKKKIIIVDPLPADEQYTTTALDLMLGKEFFQHTPIAELNSSEPAGIEHPLIVDLRHVKIQDLLQRYGKPFPKEHDGSFILPKGKFVLGITREYVYLPRKAKIAARVEGRSTLARLGLSVHFTAPTIHAGFSGQIVLEMFNFGEYPLRMHPDQLAICQLVFERVGRQPRGPVNTAYQNQRSIR